MALKQVSRTSNFSLQLLQFFSPLIFLLCFLLLCWSSYFCPVEAVLSCSTCAVWEHGQNPQLRSRGWLPTSMTVRPCLGQGCGATFSSGASWGEGPSAHLLCACWLTGVSPTVWSSGAEPWFHSSFHLKHLVLWAFGRCLRQV